MRTGTAALRRLIPAVVLCLAVTGPAAAAEIAYNLTAEARDIILPDGTSHRIWAYRLSSAAAGSATIPGPTLVVTAGDILRINLVNNLTEHTSIVIPGLRAETMTPVNFPGGRVRSFTPEAGPGGGTRTYRWLNTTAGTYLYESGTDPSKQVQLGLYGAVIVRPASPGQAYASAATAFDNEIVMVLSEIDPSFHLAVKEGRYVPGTPPELALPGQITSTVDHKPKYFLINGLPYADPYAPLNAGQAGDTTLVRLLNAGLRTHVMTLQGMRMDSIAEDGNLLNYPKKDLFSEFIEPGQTRDLLLRPTSPGLYALYDRRQNVTDAGVFPGGMIAFLEVLPASGCQVSAHISANGPVFYCQGSSVTLNGSGSVAVGCAGSLSYQWKENAGNILGATAATYAVPSSKPPGVYSYTLLATCSTDAACSDLSDPPASVTVASNAVPGAVQNFQILNRDIWLQLSWDATPGAVTYRIYSDFSPSGPFTTLYATDITATSATITKPFLTTYFKVVAVNACGVEGPK